MKLHRKWNLCLQSKVWFMLPSLVGVSIFVIIPFLGTIKSSLFLTAGNLFCGLENYRVIFKNEAFLLAVKNTCRFVGICLPLLILISFLLAAGIYRSRWMKILKSIYLFPLAVPTAVVGLIWKMLFCKNGLLNLELGKLGMVPVDWLSTNASFFVLVISYLWKNMGYTIVLWIAGMAGISENMLEAARIDGATEVQCLRYMILPGLKPALYTITILSFLNSFKVFREAYLVAGAYPQKSMYLLQHLFNNWFSNLEVDKMSAAAVVIAAIFTAVSLLLQKVWEKEENG